MRSRRSTWVDVEHNTIGGDMRLATILLSAVLSGCGLVALAQSTADYPHRAVRIIVPLAAGGNLDILARPPPGPGSETPGQAAVVQHRPRGSSPRGKPVV